MPVEERAWFELLNEGRDDVFHFFRQLGFGRSILRTELKRLSHEVYDHDNNSNNIRQADSDTPLRDFYNQYPIIYDCIQASFLRIPSNSRLGEMGHSFSRNFYTSQTPMTRMDHNLNFLINHTYPQRKLRRGIGKSSRKHLDSKAKQSKSGAQVKLVGRTKYSFEAMARLPAKVKQESHIRALNEKGVMRLEEDRNKRIVEHFEDIKKGKRRRNKMAELDMDEVRSRAKRMKTDHDINWHNRDYTLALQLHEEFLKKSAYWGKITGQLVGEQDKSNLHKEIRLVLPHFYCEDVANATASALKSAKSDDNINLGKHLKKIEAIVKLKEKNTLSDDDGLEEMTELDRYKLFIKADQSPRAAMVKEQLESRRKRTKNVLKLFGTKPRYGMSSTEEEQDEGDSDGEHDNNTLVAYLNS